MNIIFSLFLIVPAGWLPVPQQAGCPEAPATRAVCGVADAVSWVTGLPARVWHSAVTGWPWLLAVAAVVLVLALAAWVAHRAAWRRAVAGGYWVRVIPPRLVDPGHAEGGWRLLAGLAWSARKGWWRLAKPPLAFEVYQREGRLTAGLWLPGWVPRATVIDEMRRVWPGSVLDRTDPPTLHDGGGQRVAGVRLRADRPDTGALVDDTRMAGTPARGAFGGDRLQAVFDALGRPDGPALLQVLVRPAPVARLTALDRASRYPATPRKKPSTVVLDRVLALLLGAIWLVLDAITELVSTGRRTPSHHHGNSHGGDGLRRVDPVRAKAMREAAEKLAGGPHVIAAVRVGVSRPGGGFARAAARSAGYGFRTVARHLFPVRMRSAATLLDQRRARTGEWLLLSTAELAVLAHLPADPARHGFDTTALHRPWPAGASRADPERRTRRTAGWTRIGWTGSTGPDATDGDPDEHDPNHDNTNDDEPPPLEAA
ncbi:hypothetical protein ACQEVC_34655 [Plantactinospora sp. CA-294935]|uniref:hypothetical protein n=1 Tax=Plantactinospora sp. CA-294935 TaxID=3240012 RepID=UPI003D918A0F